MSYNIAHPSIYLLHRSSLFLSVFLSHSLAHALSSLPRFVVSPLFAPSPLSPSLSLYFSPLFSPRLLDVAPSTNA